MRNKIGLLCLLMAIKKVRSNFQGSHKIRSDKQYMLEDRDIFKIYKSDQLECIEFHGDNDNAM